MRRWAMVALFLILAILPALVQFDPYWLSLLSKLYINAMLAVSIWPLFVIGRLTLGHGAFYGLGAYAVSLFMQNLGWSFWLALPVTLLLVALVAALFGYPTLRIRGAYFVIATFAFGEILRLVYLRFDGLFGGAQGLFHIPGPSPLALPALPALTFDSFASQYYLMLVSLAVLTLLCYRYVHCHLGLVMRSIHDADHLAEALGINVFAYQIGTFVLSAVGAALAGALYAAWAHYLEPNLFGIAKSIDAQAYVIVGGSGFALGPILGATFLTLLPEYLNMAKERAPIVTGLILILSMFLLRGGLVTLPGQLASGADNLGRLYRSGRAAGWRRATWQGKGRVREQSGAIKEA